MQIYVVRYNPFLYHLGLKLNVKPFPIICALLCLERNKYGKERFIVGCLVFIKWYVWSLTKEFKFSSILQTQESVMVVAFSASSGDLLSWHISGQGSRVMLALCVGLPWLWAALLLCWGSCSTLSCCCPRALCGLCSLTGTKPARGRVYPLLVVLPTLHWLCLRCLQVLQLRWESCSSCARDPAVLGTQTALGKSVKVLSVEECLGSLTPLQSAFMAPRTLSAVYMWKEQDECVLTNRAWQSACR